MEELFEWILDGPDWIRQTAFSDLLNTPPDDQKRKDAARKMRKDGNIRCLLSDIQEIDTVILKRHNDAGHMIHKLAFLSELGFSKEDPGIKEVISSIFNHQSNEGPFQILSNYPTHFDLLTERMVLSKVLG